MLWQKRSGPRKGITLGEDVTFVDARGQEVMREKADGTIEVNAKFGKMEKADGTGDKETKVKVTPGLSEDGRAYKIETVKEE